MRNQRHFPYKHPLFGRGKLDRKGDNSVYYYWWAFLRRNPDYLRCCESGGKGRLASLYADFGDVRGDSFKDWWQEGGRGVRLFAEPQDERSVEVLPRGAKAPLAEEVLTVAFPLHLPKRFLQSKLKDLLKRHHKGARGQLHSRKSRAKYRVTGQPNIKALKKTLEVWDALHENLYPGAKRSPHWLIAKKLKLVPEEKMPKPTDPSYVAELKRGVMAATVGRLKKRAELLIRQAASTSFLRG